MAKVRAVPEGYHTVTPFLSVNGASDAIAFYKKAFGATELYRLEMPGGKIGHAELQLGDSRIMLADEAPDVPGAATSPRSLGGTSFGLLIYLENVDARFKQAERRLTRLQPAMTVVGDLKARPGDNLLGLLAGTGLRGRVGRTASAWPRR